MTHINKPRNVNCDITTDTNDIQKIFREYFESLYGSTLENLEHRNKHLDTCDFPKLNQKDKNDLN
jgi:hypothetical protein